MFQLERILILGASGLVGKALSKELTKQYEVYGTHNNNRVVSIKPISFDIIEWHKILDILNAIKPSMIVYCLRGNFAYQIELLNELVKYLKPVHGKLYFCSTANVFDGDPTIPHFKNHKPIAESEYGKFKIECERILKETLEDNSIIIRLPMIWGKDSPRLNSLITALNNNEKVHVYTNLYLNTNTDEMLAKQMHYIIENELKGVFHLGSKETINHYEFLKKLIAHLGYDYLNFNEEMLPVEKYYLAVLPNNEDLSIPFNFSNQNVINHLTS